MIGGRFDAARDLRNLVPFGARLLRACFPGLNTDTNRPLRRGLLKQRVCRPKFPPPGGQFATFSRSYGTPPFVGRLPKGGDEMNEGAELATAGLVMAFAAVLLVASHLFIQSQSAKQLVKGSIDLKITTNTVASWL